MSGAASWWELHDQVCQNLAILGLTLESLKMRALKEPRDKPLLRVGEVSALVEQTSEVARELMAGWRPKVLDPYGLLEGLRRWAGQFSQRTRRHLFFTFIPPEKLPNYPGG
ncbi:MAG: histidine kinase [Deltaproteobacteria bacterium]